MFFWVFFKTESQEIVFEENQIGHTLINESTCSESVQDQPQLDEMTSLLTSDDQQQSGEIAPAETGENVSPDLVGSVQDDDILDLNEGKLLP